MKKLCEWTLYRPGSDSFLPVERFWIDAVCRAVAATNIYNKTNITSSSGLKENKKIKHQFANVQFICTVPALKTRNNNISNPSLSETDMIFRIR